MLQDGEEVALGEGVHRQVAQHAEDLLRLCELHTDVLEAVDQLLQVRLSVLVKYVQVSGQVVELDLTEALREGEGRRREGEEGKRRGGEGRERERGEGEEE